MSSTTTTADPDPSVPPQITNSAAAMGLTSTTPDESTFPPGTGGSVSKKGNSRALSPLTTAAVTAISSTADVPSQALHDEDAFSCDDNIHEHSNTSSVQVTPAKKQLRFGSRTSTRATSPSRTSTETSVLSCQLALLAALTAEMETSVNRFEKEQWQTRIFQVNQVMQMVQWEANGLYGLAETN